MYASQVKPDINLRPGSTPDDERAGVPLDTEKPDLSNNHLDDPPVAVSTTLWLAELTELTTVLDISLGGALELFIESGGRRQARIHQ
jgi:hypothetical protein